MTVTAQDVKDTFSEFSGTSDATINIFLAQAERRVNADQWSDKADDATLWLTAHLLKIEAQLRSGGDAASGPVKSKRVGDLAISYEVPEQLSRSFMGSTAYGQYYLDLTTSVWPTRVLGACCTSSGSSC